MKTILLSAILYWLAIATAYPQTATDQQKQASIQQYYQLAMQYKNGSGMPMDYAKAVYYFNQAADLGDAQSIYALAYMKYKGLGCSQDYTTAVALFGQGALQGKDNSMYFYGLCWRNGYGLAKNEDSAKYWLRKSAALGYKQAMQELAMKTGENNNDLAKVLVQQISNTAIPDKTTLNQYKKIQNQLPSAEVVAGNYIGYLIQYDWSGQNMVSVKKLALNIAVTGAELTGGWTEDGLDSVLLHAQLKNDSIIFTSTHYRRKDHYSPDSGVIYDFKDATLNLVQANDTFFLAGNISMFSPERGEPSKPLFVALERITKKGASNDIKLAATPSPFISNLNVEFTIPTDAAVEVQLINTTGAAVYRNPAGLLAAGHYLLPLQPGYIAPGVYLVKVIYGNHIATVKVLKGG